MYGWSQSIDQNFHMILLFKSTLIYYLGIPKQAEYYFGTNLTFITGQN